MSLQQSQITQNYPFSIIVTQNNCQTMRPNKFKLSWTYKKKNIMSEENKDSTYEILNGNYYLLLSTLNDNHTIEERTYIIVTRTKIPFL